jgi:subtilisin family serine protease
VSLINRVITFSQQRGMLVVAAAGNAPASGVPVDIDHDGNAFQAYCNAHNVVCVAATGPTSGGTVGPWPDPDSWATYSNYGRSAVSVAAPGGTTVGLVWAACSRTSLLRPVCQTGTFVVGIGGTSQATPHVSGVAALLVERYGRNPQVIRSKLQQTADDINLPGVDPFSGKGRVNAARAAGAID